MMVCKKCKATKLEGKWIPTHHLRGKVIYTLCPTCSTEVKQVSQGMLLLDGNFFRQNSRQSMQLIQTEERKARMENVYSRIVQINQERNPIIIKTTNSKLAIQLGKQFKRMFHGELDITQNRHGVMVRWVYQNGNGASKEKISSNAPAKIAV